MMHMWIRMVYAHTSRLSDLTEALDALPARITTTEKTASCLPILRM